MKKKVEKLEENRSRLVIRQKIVEITTFLSNLSNDLIETEIAVIDLVKISKLIILIQNEIQSIFIYLNLDIENIEKDIFDRKNETSKIILAKQRLKAEIMFSVSCLHYVGESIDEVSKKEIFFKIAKSMIKLNNYAKTIEIS